MQNRRSRDQELFWKQRAHFRREIAASLESTVRNQGEPLSCSGQFGGRSDAQQSAQVNQILGPPHIVA